MSFTVISSFHLNILVIFPSCTFYHDQLVCSTNLHIWTDASTCTSIYTMDHTLHIISIGILDYDLLFMFPYVRLGHDLLNWYFIWDMNRKVHGSLVIWVPYELLLYPYKLIQWQYPWFIHNVRLMMGKFAINLQIITHR